MEMDQVKQLGDELLRAIVKRRHSYTGHEIVLPPTAPTATIKEAIQPSHPAAVPGMGSTAAPQPVAGFSAQLQAAVAVRRLKMGHSLPRVVQHAPVCARAMLSPDATSQTHGRPAPLETAVQPQPSLADAVKSRRRSVKKAEGRLSLNSALLQAFAARRIRRKSTAEDTQ